VVVVVVVVGGVVVVVTAAEAAEIVGARKPATIASVATDMALAAVCRKCGPCG